MGRGDWERPRGGRWGRRLLLHGTSLTLCIGLVLLLAVRFSVVRGTSMAPSIHDGDRLVVKPIADCQRDIQRFDVVILRSPVDPDVDYVKRVVGLPGDRVRLVDGQLWVGGVPVVERFGHVADHDTTRELCVPDDAFFVLGDNRPVSSDSREFGCVPAALVRGKVVARVWPPAGIAVFP